MLAYENENIDGLLSYLYSNPSQYCKDDESIVDTDRIEQRVDESWRRCNRLYSPLSHQTSTDFTCIAMHACPAHP